MARLTLAFTADLHMNHAKGQDAVAALIAHLEADPPDVLILGGDVSVSVSFGEALERFAGVRSRKAVIAGNHDLWVPTAHPTDSLHAYQEVLPAEAARHGFHWLDGGPLLFPEHGLALAGSVNWYDHSWAIEAMQKQYPEELHRLQSKRFLRGRHNDAVFVRMPLDDVGFTALTVGNLERHLEEALEQVPRCIVVAHHPPFQGLSFPRPDAPRTLENTLWDAFAGNTRIEALLARHAACIPFAFCGHTHRQREGMWAGIQGHNIGGDYGHKRLLRLEWPTGTMTAHEFGNAR